MPVSVVQVRVHVLHPSWLSSCWCRCKCMGYLSWLSCRCEYMCYTPSWSSWRCKCTCYTCHGHAGAGTTHISHCTCHHAGTATTPVTVIILMMTLCSMITSKTKARPQYTKILGPCSNGVGNCQLPFSHLARYTCGVLGSQALIQSTTLLRISTLVPSKHFFDFFIPVPVAHTMLVSSMISPV